MYADFQNQSVRNIFFYHFTGSDFAYFEHVRDNGVLSTTFSWLEPLRQSDKTEIIPGNYDN